MAKIYCKSSYLLRRDTAANWSAKNPILREGEEGYETDTGKRKVGDGTTEWNNLKYDSGIVDQTYNPDSENAQSGKAVAEAVAPKANKTEVDKLKGDKVNKDGVNQVSFYNIDGFENVGNIASQAVMLAEGQYPYKGTDDGKLYWRNNNSLNTYIIPCENSTYIVDYMRFWCIVESDKETVIGDINNGNVIVGEAFNATTAGYLVFTVSASADVVICKGTSRETKEIWKAPKLLEQDEITAQNANTTEDILDFQNSVKQGIVLTYTANFETFTSLNVGFSGDSDWATNYKYYFEITATDVIWRRNNGQPDITETHGLTISNFIGVRIFDDGNHNWSIELVSVGGSYTHEFEGAQNGPCLPFAVFAGTNISNNKLAITFNNLNKNIWMFGDSYFSHLAPERWLYYLPYKDNCLIDGYSGGRGYIVIEDFKNLITIGKPKYAIWCLGMNDLGDVDGVLSTRWLTSVTEFLNVCNKNNIIPILATIPTVPTINHEKKNEWVRNSGYRYIDFAKAVGATAGGTWYDGLLSSDGVHPSTAGAKVLYGRAMTDFPEFAID